MTAGYFVLTCESKYLYTMCAQRPCGPKRHVRRYVEWMTQLRRSLMKQNFVQMYGGMVMYNADANVRLCSYEESLMTLESQRTKLCRAVQLPVALAVAWCTCFTFQNESRSSYSKTESIGWREPNGSPPGLDEGVSRWLVAAACSPGVPLDWHWYIPQEWP